MRVALASSRLLFGVGLLCHLSTWPLVAQPNAQASEAQLGTAAGREKLELLVEILFDEKDAARAVPLGTEALELLRVHPDQNLELKTLNRLAFAHIVKGDYRLALELEARAQTLAQTLKNKSELALALRNEGRAYRGLSEYQDALESYGKAVVLFEEIDDRQGYGDALKDTGVTYWMLSDLPQALDFFYRAHRAYEETGDRQGIAAILNNIGIVQRRLVRPDKALEFYHRALEIRRQVGPTGSLANVLTNIGNIHRDQAQPAKALDYYFQSLEIGLADQHGHTNTLNNIAAAYEDLGNLDHALDYYQQALELKREIGEKNGMASGLFGIARVRRRQGKLLEAVASLRRSIEIAEEVNSRVNAQDAYQELSATYAGMGRHQDALEAFQRYEQIKSEIFNQRNSQYIAEMEARFETNQKEKEIQILRQQQAIDALELKKQKLTRRVLIGGLVLLGLFILLLHNRYRHKARAEKERRQRSQERVRREERERYVAELEARKAEVEARNIEMERFTYTVSHDLKSPLVTIRGFLGLVERDALAGNTDRMKKDLARIHAASDRMARLLDEVLQLSRIGRVVNEPEDVALVELAKEVVEQLSSQITEHGVGITVDPNLPVVIGDRMRISEVLQNLIENAVKFRGDQTEPRVVIGSRQDGEETVIFVRDNGIGIAPPYHQLIFGLFDRLDAETEGTGVGLALVKRIVEVHGGRIWVESEGEGRGSTFCFTVGTLENSPELPQIESLDGDGTTAKGT